MKLPLITALLCATAIPALAETRMLNGCEVYQHAQGHWLRVDPDCDLGVTTGSSSIDLRGVLALLPEKDESPSDPTDPTDPTDPEDPTDPVDPVDPPDDEPPAEDPPADDPPADDEGPVAIW